MRLTACATESYDRHAKDRVGAVATPLVAAAEEEFGKLPHWGSGTYGSHLADVLVSGYNLQAKYYQGSNAEMKAAMRSVTADRLMIVLVQWNGGGGHWVLVTARATRGLGQASDYTVLDPGGYVVPNRGSTNYRPPYSSGAFAGYYVLVTGRNSMGSPGKIGVKVM